MEDMNPALKDERTFIFTNGSLKLQEVRREDAGNFTCLAENDQNNVSIIARLVVKGETRFSNHALNQREIWQKIVDHKRCDRKEVTWNKVLWLSAKSSKTVFFHNIPLHKWMWQIMPEFLLLVVTSEAFLKSNEMSIVSWCFIPYTHTHGIQCRNAHFIICLLLASLLMPMWMRFCQAICLWHQTKLLIWQAFPRVHIPPGMRLREVGVYLCLLINSLYLKMYCLFSSVENGLRIISSCGKWLEDFYLKLSRWQFYLGANVMDVLENCDAIKCEMICLHNTLNHRSTTNNISAYQIVWIQPTQTLYGSMHCENPKLAQLSKLWLSFMWT